ncbi:MAG: response regulator transcription factor [Ideonella sp.]|nr:response regulator transcription factor [Ideonella sp.]
MIHHSAPIRIFLVDDHPMIRHGLAAMIEGEDDFILVGDAASGDEALDRIPPLRPDVVLMDLVMPGTDGITTIERLHPGLPETRFVVLTSLLEPGEIRRAIKARRQRLPAEERDLAGADHRAARDPRGPPRAGSRGHRTPSSPLRAETAPAPT